jgi:hypothetical protein
LVAIGGKREPRIKRVVRPIEFRSASGGPSVEKRAWRDQFRFSLLLVAVEFLGEIERGFQVFSGVQGERGNWR